MASLPRVFVTRPLPAQALARLEGRAQVRVGPDVALLSPEALREGAADADALVCMLSDRIDVALLSGSRSLRIVANYAAGFNNVDLRAAEELGIWVTNTPDATTDATADLAIGLLLAVARRIPEAERHLRAGRFEGWTPTHFLGAHLGGATLGIVGMGRIGRAVARRAAGFGLRLLYAGRRRLPEDEERACGALFRPLDQLLSESDFVSLHCPLDAATRHLIDAAALARMKPTAFLINTARGPVVDEQSLARALHDGRLRGAALDVFEEEPRIHPLLLAAPNAVLVPHIGTSTDQTRLAMADKALEDVVRVLEGGPPLHPVNRPGSRPG